MFKSRTEGSVVFKCTVRLLEELDVLECEFQVCNIQLERKKNRQIEIMRNVAQISNESALDSNRDLIIDSLCHRFFLGCEVNENRLWLFTIFKPCSVKPNHYTINSNYDFIYISSFSSYHLTFDGY